MQYTNDEQYFGEEYRRPQLIPTNGNPSCCIDIINTTFDLPQEDFCPRGLVFLPAALSLLSLITCCLPQFSTLNATLISTATMIGSNLLGWTGNFFCNVRARNQALKRSCASDEEIARSIAAADPETAELNRVNVLDDGQILQQSSSHH